MKPPVRDDDMMLLYGNRIANLKKLYPYVDPNLNEILMRFSAKAQNFYTNFRSLISDLRGLFPAS